MDTQRDKINKTQKTLCDSCSRSDDWNWSWDQEKQNCGHTNDSPSCSCVVLLAGRDNSTLTTLKQDIELFKDQETSSFSPPNCSNCNRNDRWVCNDDNVTYPNKNIKSLHKCLCGSEIQVWFPINLNSNLISTNIIKTYIRSNFTGFVPPLDQVIHNMRLSDSKCDYPNCDKKLKVLQYFHKTKENILGGIEFLPNVTLNDSYRILVYYYIEGNCRITYSGYGPYHRLDFCEEHKSEGNQPDNLFVVMDWRDFSLEGSDHVLKYKHEKSLELNSVKVPEKKKKRKGWFF